MGSKNTAATPSRLSSALGVGSLCAAFTALALVANSNNGRALPTIPDGETPWHLDPEHPFNINLGPLLNNPDRGKGCSVGILEPHSSTVFSGKHRFTVREFLNGQFLSPRINPHALTPSANVSFYDLDLGNHLLSLSSYDIVNLSIQGQTPYIAYDSLQSLIGTLSKTGRNGLGTVFFSAAGNKTDGMPYYEADKNMAESITIGAINRHGARAHFSPRASYVFMVSPGDGVTATGERILNGTSFATPITSAAGCMIHEANPSLGYRDIQEIFALSARRHPVRHAEFQSNGSGIWNGGGYAYDSRNGFGFGLIDVYAAVRLAESWHPTPPATAANQYRQRYRISNAKLTNQVGQQSYRITFPRHEGRITDHISLQLSGLRYHPGKGTATPGQASIQLISPSGTNVTLFTPFPEGPELSQDKKGFTVDTGTHYFRGEDVNGDWTIRIIAPRNYRISVESWAVTLTTQDRPDAKNYVYTNDFGHGYGSDRIDGTLMRDGSINTAAVSSDTKIYLDGSAPSQIANRAVHITPEIISRVSTGDGNDHIIGPKRGATIMAGRGDDRIETRGNSNNIIYRVGIDGHDVIIPNGQSTDRLSLRYSGLFTRPSLTWVGDDLRMTFGKENPGSITFKNWTTATGVQTIIHEHIGLMSRMPEGMPRKEKWFQRLFNW